MSPHLPVLQQGTNLKINIVTSSNSPVQALTNPSPKSLWAQPCVSAGACEHSAIRGFGLLFGSVQINQTLMSHLAIRKAFFSSLCLFLCLQGQFYLVGFRVFSSTWCSQWTLHYVIWPNQATTPFKHTVTPNIRTQPLWNPPLQWCHLCHSADYCDINFMALLKTFTSDLIFLFVHFHIKVF